MKIMNILSNFFIKNPKRNSAIILLVLSMVLKTLIVMVTYNKIWPKLVKNTGQDTSKFKPLNFLEAFLFVLLFMFL